MSVDALQTKIRKLKNPTAVSLDLRPELMPPSLWTPGGDLPAAYEAFGTAILEALAGIVPAAVFNTAYFDALGAPGVAALQRLTAHAGELGYYVVVETQRCDLEEAAALCAQAYYGPLYGADALCICAFTGSDGVRPYLPYCREQGKSLFILAKTPNKSAREVQDLLSGDRVIHTVMTDLAMRWGGELMGKAGYSQLGAAVGATHPASLRELRRKYDRLFFLVPGYGLPGGAAKDVQYAFDRLGHGALLTASEPILGAWRKAGEDADFAACAVAAAEKLRDNLKAFVTVM